MNRQATFEKIFKEHLKVETYSKSIDSLFSPRLRNKIDYKPYYQRNYVWDDNKASYFIESILLGTEIPPLIFFDNNENIEVIDGRQRFETILRFMDNKFSLKKRGLQALTLLKGESWDSLAKKDKVIIDDFLDSKLRIIEFKLVNEPPLDKFLEDQVKKEIFSRYNSGITPLRKAELENAKYDDDELTNSFKTLLNEEEDFTRLLYRTFFKQLKKDKENPPIENILAFIRKQLVLPLFPINVFSWGTGRTEILSRLYDFYADSNVENQKSIIESFKSKILFISSIKETSNKKGYKVNRLALECFLWGLGILDLEDIECLYNQELAESISKHIDTNIQKYTDIDYAFSAEVMNRYKSTMEYFQEEFKINLDIYINADDDGKSRIKRTRSTEYQSTKLSELDAIRLSKPEPSRNSIDDIARTLRKRRFLIRPSYQRREVINPKKASSIIESILLGITLPAVFIYKRSNGLHEVIDGQQRLLTILGFMGNEYINEKNESTFSKNHKFTLRKLRILKELNGCSFENLSENFKDKIYDFQLYLVEIDQNQNPKFDPVDLFIRLNDKPYPIRENSFEMWNSWADIETIQMLKKLRVLLSPWFYHKQIKKATDRDRMENEELLTSLAYIEFYKKRDSKAKVLDVYQKINRINARINSKAKLSNLMQDVIEKESEKKEFIQAIKRVKSFAKKVKYMLLDRDVIQDELSVFLKTELDSIFKVNKENKYFRRTIQDFYFLWSFLGPLNFEMVKYHRLEIKKDIAKAFKYLKNIPESDCQDNKGLKKHLSHVDKFHKKYTKDKRNIKLSEKEKLVLIRKQKNTSSLSDAPVFLGDDIDVDHIKPLAIGGKDEKKNLAIAHSDENKSKGAKMP